MLNVYVLLINYRWIDDNKTWCMQRPNSTQLGEKLCVSSVKRQNLLTLSVSTALRILSHDRSWTICSHWWMEDLNQLWKPVRANILASLFGKPDRWADTFALRFHLALIGCINRHDSQKTENQLERQKLPEAFEDFQGGVKLEDGLAHRLGQSEVLLLQSSAHPLHRYVYIISYLTGGGKEKSTLSNAATLCDTNTTSKNHFSYLLLQLPVWYAEEVHLHCAARANTRENK